MATREEIRKGILNIVAEPVDITLGQMTDEIIKYLHSKDVVIKVDRGFPGVGEINMDTTSALINKLLRDYGYVATIPLVEE